VALREQGLILDLALIEFFVCYSARAITLFYLLVKDLCGPTVKVGDEWVDSKTSSFAYINIK